MNLQDIALNESNVSFLLLRILLVAQNQVVLVKPVIEKNTEQRISK